MKFCQKRLSPPLIVKIVAKVSIESTEVYSREAYEEYIESRKMLIDNLNRIEGCYTPIPMGAFYTVEKLPVDDYEKFCSWYLSDFVFRDELIPTKINFSRNEFDCIGDAIMMTPTTGFYTVRSLGKNHFCFVYALCKNDLQQASLILDVAIK